MKGNEAVAEAALRAGCRFFSGYPITPQNEIPEYLSRRLPELGGVFVQGESEIAAINMVYGAAATGTRAMTSSSNPGISLKAEGISTLAGSRLPAVIVDVSRAGVGTGQILPGQSQYNVATKAPGHGGFKVIVLAPATVQEAVDLTWQAFDYADRDRNPVIVLMDGVIGGMMEAVSLPPMKTEFPDKSHWQIDDGRNRDMRVVSSYERDCVLLEQHDRERAALYERWEAEDIRHEAFLTDDAEEIIVAYGTSARVAKSAVLELRRQGVKIGLIRPIIVSPFPFSVFDQLDYARVKSVLVVEMCIPGLMVADVRSAVARRAPVRSFGRSGGIILSPGDVIEAVRQPD